MVSQFRNTNSAIISFNNLLDVMKKQDLFCFLLTIFIILPNSVSADYLVPTVTINSVNYDDFTLLCAEGIPLLMEDHRPRPCQPRPWREEQKCPRGFWCHEGDDSSTFYCCPDSRKVTNFCHLPPATGFGKNNMRRFYYDWKTDGCHELQYTGLGGNRNSFMTYDKCESTCRGAGEPPRSVLNSIKEIKDKTTKEGKKVDKGKTKSNIGIKTTSLNNLKSQSTMVPPIASFSKAPEEVKIVPIKNKSTTTKTTTLPPQTTTRRTTTTTTTLRTTTTTIPITIPPAPAIAVENPCDQIPDPGLSGGVTKKMWYFDTTGLTCVQFTFMGSGGNGNRFESADECISVCGIGRPSRKSCDLPPAIGDGSYKVPRYYFDKTTKQCELFFYSGHNGNDNRFYKKHKCERLCLGKKQKKKEQTPSPTTAPPPTRLPARTLQNLVPAENQNSIHNTFEKFPQPPSQATNQQPLQFQFHSSTRAPEIETTTPDFHPTLVYVPNEHNEYKTTGMPVIDNLNGQDVDHIFSQMMNTKLTQPANIPTIHPSASTNVRGSSEVPVDTQSSWYGSQTPHTAPVVSVGQPNGEPFSWNNIEEIPQLPEKPIEVHQVPISVNIENSGTTFETSNKWNSNSIPGPIPAPGTNHEASSNPHVVPITSSIAVGTVNPPNEVPATKTPVANPPSSPYQAKPFIVELPIRNLPVQTFEVPRTVVKQPDPIVPVTVEIPIVTAAPPPNSFPSSILLPGNVFSSHIASQNPSPAAPQTHAVSTVQSSSSPVQINLSQTVTSAPDLSHWNQLPTEMNQMPKIVYLGKPTDMPQGRSGNFWPETLHMVLPGTLDQSNHQKQQELVVPSSPAQKSATAQSPNHAPDPMIIPGMLPPSTHGNVPISQSIPTETFTINLTDILPHPATGPHGLPTILPGYPEPIVPTGSESETPASSTIELTSAIPVTSPINNTIYIGDSSPCLLPMNEEPVILCELQPEICPSGTFCQIGEGQSICCPFSITEPCKQQSESGVGPSRLLRWTYDEQSSQCIPLVFKGFKGNQNNFMDYMDCVVGCRAKTVCAKGSKPMFPTNPTEGCSASNPCPAGSMCHSDSGYGVCCPMHITVSFSSGSQPVAPPPIEEDPCSKNWDTGYGLESHHRWAFDKTTNKCVSFIYKGRGGNENNFITKNDCQANCKAPDRMPSRCLLSPKSGDGHQFITRYFYSPDYRQCLSFVFSGEGGNDNNFASQIECLETCVANGVKFSSLGTTPASFSFSFNQKPVCPQGKVLLDNAGEPVRCETSQNLHCPADHVCRTTGTQSYCCPAPESFCLQSRPALSVCNAGGTPAKEIRFTYDPMVDKCIRFTYENCEQKPSSTLNVFNTMPQCMKLCCNQGYNLVYKKKMKMLRVMSDDPMPEYKKH